jgi:hypothetical protein
MSSSASSAIRFLKRWGSFIALMALAAAFSWAMIRGIFLGNGTAHDLDHANPALSERLVALAESGGTAAVADLPVGADDPDWDVICYADAGIWIGDLLEAALGIDPVSIVYDPRNIYVVEDYWAFAFYDSEAQAVRIAEVNRKRLAEVDGPPCVQRAGAEVTVRPAAGDPERIAVTLGGALPVVH